MNMGINRAVSTPNRALATASNRTALPQINTANTRSNSTHGIMGFQNIFSRSTPSMTDDEMKEAVRKQAQIDASNGVFQGQEMRSLTDSFISVASPDRRSIISNQLNSLASLNGGINGISSMFVQHTSGSPSAGFRIAKFTAHGGWIPVTTNEEATRSQEILRIYNEAWNNARFGTGRDRTSAFGAVEVQSSFDSIS